MPAARDLCFAALAAFILAAPAAWQVFGYKSVLLRPWIMYSGVGVGVLKGTFTVHPPDGPAVELTPLDLLDLPAYPAIRHYEFANRVEDAEDMAAFAAPFCAAMVPGGRLSFRGAAGTRQGWQAMEVRDVCGTAPADGLETANAG